MEGRKTKGAPAQPWLDPEGDLAGFAGDGSSFPAGYAHLDHCGIDERKESGGGYDVVIHVGVGRQGVVRIKTRARASGYTIQARRPGFAPLVDSPVGPPVNEAAVKENRKEVETQEEAKHASSAAMSDAQKMELERMVGSAVSSDAAVSYSGTDAAQNGNGGSSKALIAEVAPTTNAKDPPTKLAPAADRFGAKRGFPAIAYPQSSRAHASGTDAAATKIATQTSANASSIGGAIFAEIEQPIINVSGLMTHMRRILPRLEETAWSPWRYLRMSKQIVFGADAADDTRVPLATSQDAGLFLCEYIYYASLAESKRAHAAHEGNTEGWRKERTKVVFLHCPPVGNRLNTKDVTQIIRQIIWAVATGQDETPALVVAKDA